MCSRFKQREEELWSKGSRSEEVIGRLKGEINDLELELVKMRYTVIVR